MVSLYSLLICRYLFKQKLKVLNQMIILCSDLTFYKGIVSRLTSVLWHLCRIDTFINDSDARFSEDFGFWHLQGNMLHRQFIIYSKFLIRFFCCCKVSNSFYNSHMKLTFRLSENFCIKNTFENSSIPWQDMK